MDNQPSEAEACATCKMIVFTGEYHPYTACVLYRQLGQADKVRSCLDAVLNHARREQTAEGSEKDLGEGGESTEAASVVIPKDSSLSADLAAAALALSRAARPLSNFAYNVGQHRPDWERTYADVKTFDAADNALHSLPQIAALENPLPITQAADDCKTQDVPDHSPASLPESSSSTPQPSASLEAEKCVGCGHDVGYDSRGQCKRMSATVLGGGFPLRCLCHCTFPAPASTECLENGNRSGDGSECVFGICPKERYCEEHCFDHHKQICAAPASTGLREEAEMAENLKRFMQHFMVKVEPHYERKHGRPVTLESGAWELLAFVQHELERSASSVPTATPPESEVEVCPCGTEMSGGTCPNGHDLQATRGK